MKHTLTVLASMLCLGLPQTATAQNDIDFFPINVGNYWIHRTDTLGGVYDPATYRTDILGIDTVDGVPLYQFLETMAADDGDPTMDWYTWMRIDEEGAAMVALGDAALVDSADLFETPALWWPNAAMEPGYTWEFSSYEIGDFSFVIEDTAVTEVVPAGTFDNCIKIGVTQTMGEVTIQQSSYTYAPGVGQILRSVTITVFGGLFRFELTEYHVAMVSVEGGKPDVPGRVQLHQNYPNPFNPISTIRYDLPQGSQVSLAIYDLTGREAVRLVEGYREPGSHQVRWNAREVPSGIYIARLMTPEFSKSIKMLLLK